MRSRGFTLVEMLVVMTISAILVAAAVPAFQWTIARNRVSDATNLLLSNMEFARLEAVRRGNTVSICRTLDPNAPVATLACSSASTATVDGNDWAVGWIVFEKVEPNIDEANFEAQRPRHFSPASVRGGGARVMIHSNIRPQRNAWRTCRAAPAAFWVRDVRDRLRPAIYTDRATRPMTGLALDGAARCIPMSLLGSLRVTRPSGGICP